jgi:hypothetical protein
MTRTPHVRALREAPCASRLCSLRTSVAADLFDGEEYSYMARLWTHGYDTYAPCTDILFHVSRQPPAGVGSLVHALRTRAPCLSQVYDSQLKMLKFWQVDWNHRFQIQKVAESRIRHMLGLPQLPGKPKGDLTNIEHYALGTKRSMVQLIEYSGIRPAELKSRDLCHQIQTTGLPNPPKPSA